MPRPVLFVLKIPVLPAAMGVPVLVALNGASRAKEPVFGDRSQLRPDGIPGLQVCEARVNGLQIPGEVTARLAKIQAIWIGVQRICKVLG